MRNLNVVLAILLLVIARTTSAATWYVATNGNDSADGTSWATAKQTIQAAIDIAVTNDIVLVNNGVYATGGRVANGALTNRIAIDKPITVLSVNGPAVTAIQGNKPIGLRAVRCAYVGTNATLSGFMLTSGATYPTGNNAERGGGGAWCENSGVLSNCTLTGNSAAIGGGVCYGTLNDCTLSNNSATDAGGGTFGSILNICTLVRNTANFEYGGGVYNSTLNNCTLIDNNAFYGGGAYWSVLNNSTLISNSASYSGGGAFGGSLSNCTLTYNRARWGSGCHLGTLNNCTLIRNWNADFGGGSHSANLNNCTLISNTALYGGGAHDSTLSNCALTGNSAIYNGGGANRGTLNNCMLANNSASFGGGSCSGTLHNCTLTGNSASTNGGGSLSGMLNNCIVYYNTAAVLHPNYDGSALNHSCTTPDPGGTGNITNDPQFVDAPAGNYRLSTDSPCIDRGANFYAQGATDLDGNPRIMNGGVDMGAYECQEALAPRFGYWAWAAGITNGLTNYADCATGDGYPNLLKYAAGSSATNTDNLARLADGLNNGLFRVRFNRNTNAQDVILVVECSSAITNGAAWQGVATNFLGSWGGAPNVEENGDGSPVAVAVSEIEPTSNRIFRLRVHRP